MLRPFSEEFSFAAKTVNHFVLSEFGSFFAFLLTFINGGLDVNIR